LTGVVFLDLYFSRLKECPGWKQLFIQDSLTK
jgi:hypothetical protein